MNLKEIKGSYDIIVSLGSACNPAMELKRLNLRTFSGPLDWSVSLSLSDVNRLLKNKFSNFMELENMQLTDGAFAFADDGVLIEGVQSYLIEDTHYNIISVHDFPIIPHQHWSATYTSYKEKLTNRINRFIEKITTSESVLFIRWAATYEQTLELQAILEQIVKGNFNILILCPEEGFNGVSEINWEIDKVCAVKVPRLPNDLETWNYVLEGITLSSRKQ
ncbi:MULTISPECIES: DUF1796 family putative cysteine peptidase [Priestia]|uniref:DUF1796 family putative cysteine peptidase n=1 Tax=Priestia TaxID=2800373 RepID=UPI001E55857C|nr:MULTISPECIES: DUF1796 family putative cysteine peptidase [Priestia]MCM3796891.1 papain-like cysteine peptidase [Priestia megaterium]